MRKILPGMKFGRLTVVAYSGPILTCICECGTTKDVRNSGLISGHTKSCGCLLREVTTKRNIIRGGRIRGLRASSSPEYWCWSAMIQRCTLPTCRNYSNYGGRGIKVCDRWLKSFDNFLSDMGLRPSPLHSLDRYPDNNGNYEPGNCRWTTQKEQMRNTRLNLMITAHGKTMCLTDWAEATGINYQTISERILNLGWNHEDAVSIPPDTRNYRNTFTITIDGVTKLRRTWAIENGIHPYTAFGRIKAGWDPVRAVTERPSNVGRGAKR